MTQKLRIYTDKAYIATEPKTPHTILLFPFWGISWDIKEQTYKIYEQAGKEYFELTSLEEADFILAPVAWEKNEASRQLTLQLAQKATPEKPIIVFYWYASEADVPVPNSIIFRTSFFKSTKKPTEFAMPAWREDLIDIHHGGEIILREKQAIPVIGFCGFAVSRRMRLVQMLKDVGRYIKDGVEKTHAKRRKRHYHNVRTNVLQRIKRSRLVKTNFIIRNQYFGDTKVEHRPQQQMEYLDNTINSDYVVCIRGAANVSFRLYETLCFGRIPVFINTDCVLPYDFMVDWKQYCVWVDESEIDQIDQKIMEFHNNLSPEEFIDLQKRCRAFWKEYLSPEGFFKHFHEHFEQR